MVMVKIPEVICTYRWMVLPAWHFCLPRLQQCQWDSWRVFGQGPPFADVLLTSLVSGDSHLYAEQILQSETKARCLDGAL